MFQVFCPKHGSRVLLDASRIEGLYNTTRGPAAVWRCYCGEQGTMLNGVSRPVMAMAASPDDATVRPLATSAAA